MKLRQDQIWLAGQPSQDVLILCYIRAGVLWRSRQSWRYAYLPRGNDAVGTPEDAIEVARHRGSAAQTVRGGQRLPDRRAAAS